MRVFIMMILLGVVVGLAGCENKDSNGARNSQDAPLPVTQEKEKTEAHKTRIAEGKLQPLSKHDCVRQIEGEVFLSKPTEKPIDQETKTAIESALAGEQKGPVVWVRLNINVANLIKALRENDQTVKGFRKEDFLGLVGKTKTTPIAPNGVVEVSGLDRFLRQDLIFQVPEDMSDIEVIIGPVSLGKFSLSRLERVQPETKSASTETAKTPAQTKTEESAQDMQAALKSKLAREGVKLQWKDDGSALLVEGFPYRRDLSGDYIIRIDKVEKGVFTASKSSTVPTAVGGMVYGIGGGSFLAQCNAEDGTQTLTDAVGNKWVFGEPGMSFNVYLPGSKKPAYALESKIREAMISFTKEGVLVKGFEFIVSPGSSEPEQKAK